MSSEESSVFGLRELYQEERYGIYVAPETAPQSSGNPQPPPPMIEILSPEEEEKRKLKMREKRKEEQRKKVEEQKLREKNGKIDFDVHNTPLDISKLGSVSWEEMKCSRYGYGKDGVFFLQTKHDEIVVIKGSAFLCDEIFSTRISKFFGVSTPQCDVIEFKPGQKKRDNGRFGEWNGSRRALIRLGRSNQRVMLKIGRNLDRAFFIIMEYIPGVVMTNHVKFQTKKFLTSKIHLRDIGRILIFDLIQNNYDRIPIPGICDHEGNPDNMLFKEDCVVGIDQNVNRIIEEEKRNLFLKGVQKLVEVHVSKKHVNNEFIDRLVKFVKSFAVFEIDEGGKKQIWIGMDETLQIVSSGKVTLEMLQNVKKDVGELLTGEDWRNVYKESMDRIDCDFIFEVLKVMKKTYESVEDS